MCSYKENTKSVEKTMEKSEDSNGAKLGIRHVQMIMMTFTATVLYIMRSSLGVAILAMTDKSQVNVSDAEIYDWSSARKGVILSSFFWGYTLMQIPAGILSKMYGGRLLLFLALVINGLLCLATPILAKLGSWIAVCIVRTCMGLSQACLMPGMHTLLGQWAPIQERTRFSIMAYAGIQLGTIITMPICGVLSSTSLGWRLIFYSMGGLALVTAVFWWMLTASTPAQHRFISKKELQYIENSLETKKEEGELIIPWKDILTSVPLMAILCAHVGMVWYFTIFLVEIPMYLKHGLGMDLASGSAISSLPFIAQWGVSTACSYLSDYLCNKNIVTLTQSRKLFNSLGSVLAFVASVSLSFVGRDNQKTAVFLLSASNGIIGANSCGFMLNHIDLSPRYGGIMFGLTNAIGNLIGLMGPISTGFILGDDPSDISRWRIVFCVAGTFILVTDIVYRIFATSERQIWDDPDYVLHKYKMGFLRKASIKLGFIEDVEKSKEGKVYEFQAEK